MTRALLVAVALLVAALGWSLWRAESHKGAAERAEENARQAQASATRLGEVLADERARVADMDTIGSEHEEDRRDAESVPDTVADDLRAGAIRLRNEWAGCETRLLSATAATAAERDALAASRERLAGDLVRVGRDADDQLRACQAVIRADRQ